MSGSEYKELGDEETLNGDILEGEEGEEEIQEDFDITSNKSLFTKRRLVIIAGVLIFILFAVTIIASSVIFIPSGDDGDDFDEFLNSYYGPPVENAGVVIDMGSSGSRVWVLGWDSEHVVQPLPYGGPSFLYSSINPGISTFITPKEAAESLDPLLDYAKRGVLACRANLTETPLLVYGTGGLRALPKYERDAILLAIDSFVRENYSFYLPDNWLGILEGNEEAGLDWITIQETELILNEQNSSIPINYLDSSIQTIGILDMGGSSMEVSFEPESTARYDSINFDYNGDNVTLYAVSYEGFGHNTALNSFYDLVKVIGDTSHGRYINPCIPSGCILDIPEGNFIGTGNPSECKVLIDDLLGLYLPCEYDGECSFNGKYQPPIDDNVFIAFSEFGDVASFFGLDGQIMPADLEHETSNFCRYPWDELYDIYSPLRLQNKTLANYCFQGLYQFEVLTSGLGFDENTEQIAFYTKLYNKLEVSWAIGLMTTYVENGTTIYMK